MNNIRNNKEKQKTIATYKFYITMLVVLFTVGMLVASLVLGVSLLKSILIGAVTLILGSIVISSIAVSIDIILQDDDYDC